MRTRRPLDYRTPSTLGAPRFDKQGFLILIALGLWFVLCLLYAGSGWSMLLYRLLIDGVIVMLWVTSAFGIGSLLLSVLWPRGHEHSSILRAVTATAFGLGTISLVTLGLGLAGWLNRTSAIAMVSIGVIATVMPLVAWRDAGKAVQAWLPSPAQWSWLWLLTVPFASLMTVAALVPPGLLWKGEPAGYDVVEYHLQVPREWYEIGRIVPLHHNVYSFFPFNVEMHYLLAMHLRGGPWAGMYLAQFMHGTYIMLSVIAVYAIALQWVGKQGAVLAGVATATVPWMAQLGSIAYD